MPSSSGETNKRIVTNFFSLIGKEGFGRAIATLSDDAVWWTPLAGSRSKSEMLEFASGLDEVLASPLTIDLRTIIAEGDLVAIEAQSTADLKNGKHYSNSYSFFITIRDGVISDIREHFDTHYSINTFGSDN